MSGFCRQCGTPLPQEGRHCVQCGASNQPVAAASTERAAAPGSLNESLHSLGVGWLAGKVGIVIIATLAGLGVAHALPYVYDPIFGRLVSALVGTSATPLRDTVTELIMTGTTFLTGFLVAFFPDRILEHVRRITRTVSGRQRRTT
ncbi:hypothetical protein Mal4_56530 [Maioricimonas rarisocia]|uniref:Zinc-ribbon domain-containing protein n=1 Tax=Maioricimonas rarisocia TaxID=2528026 RepID=A0A517ZFM8_9PLAN|nr:zinc ribbon domain-containing protein [Maioricimonas rarisocia]QDU41287.1 hypothetical protein Mal4_56530 [Maioricimonas rarisocia]